MKSSLQNEHINNLKDWVGIWTDSCFMSDLWPQALKETMSAFGSRESADRDAHANA